MRIRARLGLSEKLRLFPHLFSKAVYRVVHPVLVHGGEEPAIVSHAGVEPLNHPVLFVHRPIPQHLAVFVAKGQLQGKLVFRRSGGGSQKPEKRSFDGESIGEHLSAVSHYLEPPFQDEIGIAFLPAEREEDIFEEVGMPETDRRRLGQVFRRRDVVCGDG